MKVRLLFGSRGSLPGTLPHIAGNFCPRSGSALTPRRTPRRSQTTREVTSSRSSLRTATRCYFSRNAFRPRDGDDFVDLFDMPYEATQWDPRDDGVDDAGVCGGAVAAFGKPAQARALEGLAFLHARGVFHRSGLGRGCMGTLEHAVHAARGAYCLGPVDANALADALAWERIHCSTCPCAASQAFDNPDGCPTDTHQLLDALALRTRRVDPAAHTNTSRMRLQRRAAEHAAQDLDRRGGGLGAGRGDLPWAYPSIPLQAWADLSRLQQTPPGQSFQFLCPGLL
ncbi:hypothetical protein GGX14DRAFT_646106 [Mycena pura]|uniref:Uncharacterized protein n=1 Tax=Mycena pura TaxID=153505 RepID=A0AAD6VB98_9AGAR|nr:hypothetical protein GGX14DRAFT_646106 [Mycena pura]